MMRTKSVRWTWPSASKRTLSGFTSRCIMPCPWIYLRAQPSSAIQKRTASSVKVFLEMWNRRSPPLMRSTTRYLRGRQHRFWFESPRAGGRGGGRDDWHRQTYMYSMSWKL